MLKRVCKCSTASKLVWVLGQHFAHKKLTQSLYHSHTSYLVLATKQTLLSVLLANHALLETYFQDEDSQMDTIEAQGPLVNLRPEVQRMKTFAKLKTACCYLMSFCHYVTMSLCHYVMLNTLVTFQIKFKSLKLKFMIHTSLLGLFSSSTEYKSEKN